AASRGGEKIYTAGSPLTITMKLPVLLFLLALVQVGYQKSLRDDAYGENKVLELMQDEHYGSDLTLAPSLSLENHESVPGQEVRTHIKQTKRNFLKKLKAKFKKKNKLKDKKKQQRPTNFTGYSRVSQDVGSSRFYGRKRERDDEERQALLQQEETEDFDDDYGDDYDRNYDKRGNIRTALEENDRDGNNYNYMNYVEEAQEEARRPCRKGLRHRSRGATSAVKREKTNPIDSAQQKPKQD
ncbi:hypothetical protein OTU49_011070, partial [Cherax quadricarinatus]